MKERGEWVQIRRLRCGECGLEPFELIEIVEVESGYDVQRGKRSAEAYHNPGSIIRVVARCACGHHWRLRGVVTVDGLSKEVQP